jgi:hypothetical protein
MNDLTIILCVALMVGGVVFLARVMRPRNW